MGAFRVPLILVAVALVLGTFANMVLRSINMIRLGNYALVAMMVVFLIAAHMALVTFSPVLSSKALADAIGPRIKTGDVVEINGEYEAGSTLGFYLRRQVRILNGRSSNLWYGSFFQGCSADIRRCGFVWTVVAWADASFFVDSDGSGSRVGGAGLYDCAEWG